MNCLILECVIFLYKQKKIIIFGRLRRGYWIKLRYNIHRYIARWVYSTTKQCVNIPGMQYTNGCCASLMSSHFFLTQALTSVQKRLYLCLQGQWFQYRSPYTILRYNFFRCLDIFSTKKIKFLIMLKLIYIHVYKYFFKLMNLS